MSNTQTSDILIVGAGLAGLAAAVALSHAGAKTTMLERKPYVGGRAYSYPHPALDEIIDSQHVMLGCCTNLIDLCRQSGADRHIRWYDAIQFLEPADGTRSARRSEIAPGIMPAPFHSSWSFLRASMLSFTDKTRIALGLMEFMRGYPENDNEPFSAWLQRTRQTERAIKHFWEPVIVGALNDDFERCSTRYAGQVFHESFLKSAEGGRLGIPTQPMGEFYESAAELAVRQGTNLPLRKSVDRLEKTTSGWRAITSDSDAFEAEQLLLALPFEQTVRLLKTLPEGTVALPAFDRFIHAPITTIHLWFDRAVTQMDHAALVDTRIQWMFNKSNIRRNEPGVAALPGQYLELVISASFPELHKTRDAIFSDAFEELCRFFPAAQEAHLVKSGILKEARATFSVTPGLDQWRPSPEAGNGLFLAGDWTRTGWPSTMEGAVRSGRLAAESMANSVGNRLKCMTPDLPANGFMKFLTGNSVSK